MNCCTVWYESEAFLFVERNNYSPSDGLGGVVVLIGVGVDGGFVIS